MNLPNALTVFRILALPFCAWALFQKDGQDPTWQIIAWTMFFIVGMTDVLDGRIARKRNQISNFGIILDPIADKAFIATALIGLSVLGKMPWWVTVVILIREIGVTILRFAVIRREVIRLIVVANSNHFYRTSPLVFISFHYRHICTCREISFLELQSFLRYGLVSNTLEMRY